MKAVFTNFNKNKLSRDFSDDNTSNDTSPGIVVTTELNKKFKQTIESDAGDHISLDGEYIELEVSRDISGGDDYTGDLFLELLIIKYKATYAVFTFEGF